jgi:hypothetical protein
VSAILTPERCIFLQLGPARRVETDLFQDILLQKASRLSGCPHLKRDIDYIDQAAVKSMIDGSTSPHDRQLRKTVLLCGSYLEYQVSTVALQALGEGLDVHLLCDCITGSDPALTSILLLRLWQAGVVPSSLQQVLYLWQVQEQSSDRRKAMQDLVAECAEVRRCRCARPGLS